MFRRTVLLPLALSIIASSAYAQTDQTDSAAPAASTATAAADSVTVVRRLAGSALLAAQEYALGVENGRVVLAPEVEEATLFLTEARRTAAALPDAERDPAVAQLDSVLALVHQTAPPESVTTRVRRLTEGLSQRLGIDLEEIPARAPELARGAEVYRQQCASCHGAIGGGDGPGAVGLDPAPANLADAAALRDASPLDFYRRITLGVAGTAMPAFETSLSTDDRWAAAVYSTLLRLPAPRGGVAPALAAFPTTARMSDAELLAALGAGDEPGEMDLAKLAAIRATGADAPDADDLAPVFATVRARVDSAVALARAGHADVAHSAALDAYLAFEEIERPLRGADAGLAGELEGSFAALRGAVKGAEPAQLDGVRAELLAGLERAERRLGDEMSPLAVFVQSLVLLLREGLEAILIVGALMTFLVKAGRPERRRDIHLGVGLALAASLFIAVLVETVFHLSPASQELLEGVTMLTATGVLFYVSYWLLTKIEVAKWMGFVKGQVESAVSSGSVFTLAAAAFLAVFREGVETVLFYKALFIAGGTIMPAIAGMVVGAIILSIVYVAVNRWGVRLPLRPFFAVTSAFLYYMAFVFAGKGIAELQGGGYVGTTIVDWAPRFPLLGIYPTVESLAVQGILLGLAAAALVWVFLVEPRRLRVTSVMVPDAAPGDSRGVTPVEVTAADVAAAAAAAGMRPGPSRLVVHGVSSEGTRELIRSLERMDADLAELRSEIDRIRRHLGAGQPAANTQH